MDLEGLRKALMPAVERSGELRLRQLKGEVKSRWAKLTDDDLTGIEGSFDKLVGRIQERYGYAKDDAKREVNEFLMRHPATP